MGTHEKKGIPVGSEHRLKDSCVIPRRGRFDVSHTRIEAMNARVRIQLTELRDCDGTQFIIQSGLGNPFVCRRNAISAPASTMSS
jgi:hypothetical protein